MNNSKKYNTDSIPTWCPGCGNFMIKNCLEKVFAKLSLAKEKIVITYDIGCAGNMADFLDTYAVHTLHGRAIAVAMGIKIANPKLTVIAVGGDGGFYGEGLNHLISAARANINIAAIVANNCLYSLTTGQTSPTSPLGAKTKSTPEGNPLVPIDPVLVIKTINKKVLAKKSSTKNRQDLEEKITKAVLNKGFSLLDINQECVAFKKLLEK